MKPASPRILTINGGSSSIKFALFEAGKSLLRTLEGSERIGLPNGTFSVKGSENFSRPLAAPDHTIAVNVLMEWLGKRSGSDALTAVGHRVVHGGPKYFEPQRITAEMVDELRRLSPFEVRRYGFHGFILCVSIRRTGQLGRIGSGPRPDHPGAPRQRCESGGRAPWQIDRHQHEFHSDGRSADGHPLRRSRPRTGLVSGTH